MPESTRGERRETTLSCQSGNVGGHRQFALNVGTRGSFGGANPTRPDGFDGNAMVPIGVGRIRQEPANDADRADFSSARV
jgi:hypothetical protein